MTFTREEILAMEPGQELDEITAEIARGRKVRMLNEVTNNSFKPQYDKKVIDEGAGRYNIISQYSTDISAAWEVVEKLRIAVTPQSIGAPEELSYMAEYENAPYVELKRVFAKTAQEAICKCALLAVLNL